MGRTLIAVMDVDDPPRGPGITCQDTPSQRSSSGLPAPFWTNEPAAHTSVSLTAVIAVNDAEEPAIGGFGVCQLDPFRCSTSGRWIASAPPYA